MATSERTPDDRTPEDRPPAGRTPESGSPESGPRGAARKLARKLRKQIGRAEETLDKLENCVESLEPGRPPPRAAGEREKHAAGFGVIEFSLRFRPDDWADVHISGIDFELSPVLANLLDGLAADNGRCDGPLVGWKSRDDLLRALEKRFGRPYEPHALSVAKCRLRERLEREGLSPLFVQTSPRGELRFARRRDGASASGEELPPH